MKILIDMTHICIGSIYASTSIYVFRILDSTEKEQRNNLTLLIPPDLEEYIKERYPDIQYIIFQYTTENVQKYKKGISRIIFQAKEYQRTVKKSQCDSLFIASDQYLYTCVPTSARKIVVIHDLKAIKDQSITKKIKYYIFYLLFIISSYKTIAISNYTKQDIIRHYSKLISSKIEVIFNSIQLSTKDIRPKKITEDQQYILYVNTLQEYKNIHTLLKALTLIKKNITHKLVIVGKSTTYWTDVMLPYIRKNNISDKIIHLNYVTDEELHWLYKHASLFVSCSTREGFGYTPIEAAICKCPVICTTCESLSETTLDKLEYYNPPHNEIELSNKIIKILNSPPNIYSLTKVSNLFQSLYCPKKQASKIYNLFN